MKILASVIVHIIGLAVLRNEPQMGGMHVVLPSVTQPSQVEPHSAILVFRNDQRVDDGPWQSIPLKPMPGFSYVDLNGEHIRFIVNGINKRAVIPCGLPHLKNSCDLMRDLSDGYQPPAYTAASAVVMIPNGVASACMTAQGRIDTTVTMVNTRNYQVAAGNKRITLRNNAVVMIMHVPTAWVDGAVMTMSSDLHHSQVFFSMARRPPDARGTCTLPRSFSVPLCPSMQHKPPVAKSPGVFQLAAPIDPSGTPTPPHVGSIPSTTFECSNTQWP